MIPCTAIYLNETLYLMRGISKVCPSAIQTQYLVSVNWNFGQVLRLNPVNQIKNGIDNVKCFSKTISSIPRLLGIFNLFFRWHYWAGWNMQIGKCYSAKHISMIQTTYWMSYTFLPEKKRGKSNVSISIFPHAFVFRFFANFHIAITTEK